MKEWINEMLASGYIRPSKSPCASPVIMAEKPYSNKLRLCVDYRQLNSVTVKTGTLSRYLIQCLNVSVGLRDMSSLILGLSSTVSAFSLARNTLQPLSHPLACLKPWLCLSGSITPQHCGNPTLKGSWEI